MTDTPQPPDFRVPEFGEKSLVFGGADVVEGYYTLEEQERDMSHTVMAMHRDVIHVWYRQLTLYYRGLRGGFYLGVPDKELEAAQLRMKLVGLGISSSKAALDNLLAGYYSVAFATIRHMHESVIQSHYLEEFPEESPLWYKRPGAKSRQAQRNGKKPPANGYGPPNVADMIHALKGRRSSHERVYQQVYAHWKLMCAGSHPTIEGLLQTQSRTDGRGVIGGNYNRELAAVGFDHGVAANGALLLEIAQFKPQPPEWLAAAAQTRADHEVWERRMEAELAAQVGSG
jgi:hypothetical protein